VIRTVLLTLVVCLANLAHAGMEFAAIAVPPAKSHDIAANTRLLLGAISAKSDTSLYLDKSWDGISYLLTGKHFDTTTLVGQAILGGTEIGEDMGYGPMRVLTPEQVKAISAALNDITPDMLSKRYDPAKMDREQIYPNIWTREKEDGLKFLLDNYAALQRFYKRAADGDLAIVLLIE
jgi:hypothetical protein